MLRNFIYACVTYTALADQLLGARDLKTCKKPCISPYVQDPVTCKCDATKLINPVCATGWTADTTADVCECKKDGADPAETKPFSCRYGFMLDMENCQCLGKKKCETKCEDKTDRQNKFDCTCNPRCEKIKCEKGMKQSDITCECVGRGIL